MMNVDGGRFRRGLTLALFALVWAAAVVVSASGRASQKERSQYAGTDTSGHYHFTDVWVRKGGRWQVVASHGSRFDEAH